MPARNLKDAAPAMRRWLLILFLPLSCKPVAEPVLNPLPLTGRQVYMARCIACHQADGSGIPAICPPLENSPLLSGSPDNLVRILLLGMKGEILRNGTSFNGIMPSWRFDLTDPQIAAVINELYERWHPGGATVTEEMVRRIREETAAQKLFPTAKELKLGE